MNFDKAVLCEIMSPNGRVIIATVFTDRTVALRDGRKAILIGDYVYDLNGEPIIG
jgi:hypothetical protein